MIYLELNLNSFKFTIYNMSNKILVISDIHLGFNSENEVLRKLEAVVNYSYNKVDKAIIIGDLIGTEIPQQERGIDPEEDIKKIKRVKKILNKFDEVHYIPGNHDQYNIKKEVLYNDLGFYDNKKLEDIALMDTTFNSKVAGIADLDFLQSLSDNINILISHHPLVNYDLSSNPWFKKYPEMAFCINKKWTEKELKNISPSLIINGHLHRRYFKEKDNSLCYSVNPFNRKNIKSSKVDGFFIHIDRDKNILKEFKVSDNSIETTLLLNYSKNIL